LRSEGMSNSSPEKQKLAEDRTARLEPPLITSARDSEQA
jgi:hypothetical protein